jgi:hypothetical protein
MRVGLLVAVAVATIAMPTKMSAQRHDGRAEAALVLAEGAVYLDDRSIEPNTVPRVLPDAVVVRTTQNRAAVELKRGGWLTNR